MNFEPLSIADVILIKPKKIGDNRGYFMETFRQSLFEEYVGAVEFKQENQSLSAYPERCAVFTFSFRLTRRESLFSASRARFST